jgi:hypothetical protein
VINAKDGKGVSNPASYQFTSRAVGIRQKQNKLFSAVSCRYVGGPSSLCGQHLRNRLQASVSSLMPVSIIVFLEMIDVHQQQ